MLSYIEDIQNQRFIVRISHVQSNLSTYSPRETLAPRPVFTFKQQQIYSQR